MTDACKPMREYMQQKSPDEFSVLNSHILGDVLICIVAPRKGCVRISDVLDPVVRDRYPVGISAKIGEYTTGP